MIGLVAGAVAVLGVLLVERSRIDDPIGAVAVHGMAGVWGTLATGIFAVPALAANLATGSGGLVYTGSFHQVGVQALGLLAVGAFTFTACFGNLVGVPRALGDPCGARGRDRRAGRVRARDVGLPEFYIPVPGGYGTESHGHLGPPTPVPRSRPYRTPSRRLEASG